MTTKQSDKVFPNSDQIMIDKINQLANTIYDSAAKPTAWSTKENITMLSKN